MAGCGYRFDSVGLRDQAPTISVPYVLGDIDGHLTASIIKEIATSGAYIYRQNGGEWTLKVQIIEYYDENIGFRYDRNRKCKLKHEIIPVETRSYLVAEVELIHTATCQTVSGPTRIQVNIAYDHDYYTIRNRVNIFSLGQLTEVDEAEDAAQVPLDQRLAEKIVDYVIYSSYAWDNE